MLGWISGQNRGWFYIVAWVVVPLATGILGFVVSEFTNFRSDYRAALEREIAATQDGTEQVHQSLVALARVARGKEKPSADLVKKFDQDIINLYERAGTVSGLLPETKEEFKTYKEAMLHLSESVAKLQRPEMAKSFIESISAWYTAKEKFDEKIEVARTTHRIVPSILAFKSSQ